MDLESGSFSPVTVLSRLSRLSSFGAALRSSPSCRLEVCRREGYRGRRDLVPRSTSGRGPLECPHTRRMDRGGRGWKVPALPVAGGFWITVEHRCCRWRRRLGPHPPRDREEARTSPRPLGPKPFGGPRVKLAFLHLLPSPLGPFPISVITLLLYLWGR